MALILGQRVYEDDDEISRETPDGSEKNAQVNPNKLSVLERENLLLPKFTEALACGFEALNLSTYRSSEGTVVPEDEFLVRICL